MKARAVNVDDMTSITPTIKEDERFVKTEPKVETPIETPPVEPQKQTTEEPKVEVETKIEEGKEKKQPKTEEVPIPKESWEEYLKREHGVNSFDELKLKIKEETEPENPLDNLPKEIKGFLEWRDSNEGKGTISEYATATKNWESVSDSEVINEYLRLKNSHLSTEEIDFEINRMFSFDEDTDSESDIMAKKIAKKNFVKEARDYFENVKKNFKPSGSDVQEIPKEYKEALLFYKNSLKNQKEIESKNAEIRNSFKKETEKYFSEEFKGFEFKLGEDESKFYKPTDISKLKESNLDLTNMLSKYVNEDGSIKNLAEYHRAISIASNPEEFARFFYEQGKSEGVEEITNSAKNRNISPRTTHSPEGNKSKYRAVSIGQNDFKFELKK